MPTFRLWLPVTYDIDPRIDVLRVEKWTPVPPKKKPMLRTMSDVEASYEPYRSVLASKILGLPRASCVSASSGNRSVKLGCIDTAASNSTRLVCGRTQLA